MLNLRFQTWKLSQKFINRIRYGKRLGGVIGRTQWFDDFDWTKYNALSYRREMDTAPHLRQLKQVNWSLDGSKIIVPDGQWMHPQHRIIYETALTLQPNTIFEAGCGGGDNLANLQLLLPNALLDGGDVSKEQLDYAAQRNFSNGEVTPRLLNLTANGASDGISAEFVYTNAVLMHIHGQGRPERFVQNLWNISSRYLLFVENWARHDYFSLFNQVMPHSTPYLVQRENAKGVLFDKQNAMNLPIAKNNANLLKT